MIWGWVGLCGQSLSKDKVSPLFDERGVFELVVSPSLGKVLLLFGCC